MLGVDGAHAIDDRRVLVLDVIGESFDIRRLHACRLLRRNRRLAGLQQRRERRVGSAAGELGDHAGPNRGQQRVQHTRLLLTIPVGDSCAAICGNGAVCPERMLGQAAGERRGGHGLRYLVEVLSSLPLLAPFPEYC